VPLFFCHRFLLLRRSCRRHTFVCAAALGLTAAIFFCAQTTLASSHHESAVAYTRAENIQRHLEAKPFSQRTRVDYERVLNAYRSVYHGDPGSLDAGRSIAAVADLLASEGRYFHDEKLSQDAIAQWEFLRREYPGSPLRQRALFQEAQIEQHDLHNRIVAQKIYRNFLTHYPHDLLAEQARASLENAPNHPRGEPSSLAVLSRPRASFSSAATRENAAQLSPSPVFPISVLSSDTNVSQPPSIHRTSLARAPVATIQAVRYWTTGNSTRLAVDMNEAVPYHAYLAQNAKQITLIFFGAHASESLISHSIRVEHDANLRSIRASILTSDQAELVLELSHAAKFSSFMLSNPARLVLDVQTSGPTGMFPVTDRVGSHRLAAVPALIPIDDNGPDRVGAAPEVLPEIAAPAEPVLSAPPVMDGQRSMARVLGLRIRRIVIDAGHGGHDSGTLGPGGLDEKDVALDVALRLGHLLHQRLGADVIYTRRTDIFVPLEERTAIANRAHADLFISIHANSTSDPEVRGVETYFLNFTASPDALQVAARENAISNRSVHELSDLVRKITLTDKIDESREFAGDVQQSLYTGLAFGNDGLKNRGVKQAPFAVLIGANMPSILAEISFLTNPEDASELTRPAYRERLAEALYRGVAEYVNGMSGIRVAKSTQPEALLAPAE
jgi:N-acetylmuramoyl-L-alanine amidase